MSKRKEVLQKMWKKRICRMLFFLFLCGMMVVPETSVKADSIEEAKEAIIEVYSGFTAGDGTFHKIKNASGFLIYNEDDGAYAVTTYDTLLNSEKEKNAYIKKNDVETDGYSVGDSIRVVVKGDVTMEASVVTKSEKENFAVIRLDSGINGKTTLKLGKTTDLTVGDGIYAMGFAEKANKKDANTQFISADVETMEGKMQDNAMEKEGICYLQHSAVVHDGNTGGPLLDQNGFVVGMNNAALNDEDPVIYFSLPVEVIRTILDHLQIAYVSEEGFRELTELENTLQECMQLLNDDTYKANSKEMLTLAVETAEKAMEQGMEPFAIPELIERLTEGKQHLVKKMEATKKVMSVLLVILLFLLARFFSLLMWRRRYKNKSHLLEETVKKGEKSTRNKEDVEKREKNPFVQIPAMIICERSGKRALIEKEIYSIGKAEGKNDFAISDNSAISRKHVVIQWEKGAYYIRDMGSANGTFLSGIRLKEGERVRLKEEEEITLADEKITFQISKEESL